MTLHVFIQYYAHTVHRGDISMLLCQLLPSNKRHTMAIPTAAQTSATGATQQSQYNTFQV